LEKNHDNPWASAVIPIGLAMAATLAVQLVYWHRVDPAPHGDFPRYYYQAKAMLDPDIAHASHYHYPPLYPIVLSAFLYFAGSAETAGRAACAFIAMLTVVPVYFLSRRIFNPTVAIIAATIFPFKFFQSALVADAQPLLNLALYSAVLVGLVALDRRKLWLFFMAGAMFGLSALAKAETLAFFALFVGVAAGCLVVKREALKRSAAAVVLACLGYVVAQSPYLIGYYQKSGKATLSPKVAALLFIHNEPDWDRAAYSLREDNGKYYTFYNRAIAGGDRGAPEIEVFPYLAANRGRIASAYIERLGFTIKDIVPFYLWTLLPVSAVLSGLILLAGLARPGWTRDQLWRESYLFGFGIMTVLSVPLFYPWTRFFSPLIPVLVIFLARGVEQIALRIGGVIGKVKSETIAAKSLVPITMTLAVMAVVPDLYLLSRIPVETAYNQAADDRAVPAKWISGNLAPGDKFMST